MLNNCEKTSVHSSPISVMSPSSVHSSPTNSSASITNSPPAANETSPRNFSTQLIKPSAIKETCATHQPFVPSTLPSSINFPLHSIYGAQNPYNHFSSLFNTNAIARQMSFFGNTLPQSFQVKRLSTEDFARFPSFPSTLASLPRSPHLPNSYPYNKHGYNLIPTFPVGPHPMSSNLLPNERTCHSTFQANPLLCHPSEHMSSFIKKRMTQLIENPIEPVDSSIENTVSSRRQNWVRSPTQALICPLCDISLEGIDVTKHFYEEVHKVETLRKLHDWANNESIMNENFESRSNFDKKSPFSRYETFQRIKQNRHMRLTALVRTTKRKFEGEDINESNYIPSISRDRMWSIAGELSAEEESASSINNAIHENEGTSNRNGLNYIANDCKDNEEQQRKSNNDNDENNEALSPTAVTTDGQDIKQLKNGLTTTQSESQSYANSDDESKNAHETITKLKLKIHELENKENHTNINETQCFICQKPYENPLVSQKCWHVYCQNCWNKVMESKQHCPQCDAETTSRDLRRLLF